jgi:hypothetical protein
MIMPMKLLSQLSRDVAFFAWEGLFRLLQGRQDPAQRLRRTRNEVSAYAFGIFFLSLSAGIRIEGITDHFLRDDPNYNYSISAVMVLAWLGLAFAFWRKILKKLA